MKFVIIPDSFKGTLSSLQICKITAEKIREHFPNSEIVEIPVADGGEGSVDAFLSAVGGEKIKVKVKNPYFENMESYFGLIDGGKTAVIEMASCAGLPLVEKRPNPRLTTTYGVGELMLAAAKRGVKKIIVGLGGSATNDGGCGAAVAAGAKFYNKMGQEFIPVGGTTIDIDRIDFSELDEAFRNIEIVAMCDIDNPMYGPSGASYVFAPQKGADENCVKELDQGIKNLSKVIEKTIGKDISKIPGTGAAGAMGAGMIAFFDAKLQMGIQTVLEAVQFDQEIADADYIFTGEGKLDSQSLRGKVVMGVGKRAKQQGKKVIVITGGAEDKEIEQVYDMGVTAVIPINRLPQDFSISRQYSTENLSYTVDNILRLLK